MPDARFVTGNSTSGHGRNSVAPKQVYMDNTESETAGTTVLYIEDNEDNAYMLSRRLTRRGYKVVVAPDGETGIEKAREMIPDIILMDLNLPVMDGWAATRALRQHSVTESIPVIAVSSHALPGEREIAVSAGCDEYETKPIDFERLLDKMRTLLKQGNSSSQSVTL
jgi:CheY-like chemotaxis protein